MSSKPKLVSAQCQEKEVFSDRARNALGFFNLPPEIREQIYRNLLRSANHRYESTKEGEGPYFQFDLSILRVSRSIHREAAKVFQDNIFVKITTPWPQAISHVNSEGKVAVVAMDQQANDFQSYYLLVHIDTPDLAPWSEQPHKTYSMITCVQELEAFTRIWYFSNLNNMRQLNPHLTLRLDLKNPHLPHERIPKALQRRLIMPFGEVKDLHSMGFGFHGKNFSGQPVDEEVKEAVMKAQQVPAPTPEECIESALAHKKAGNARMEAKAYGAALHEYFEAFAAIHIYIRGRERDIHCDAYYGQELQTGVYQLQYGHYVRMMLRVQLVANTVLAYLKMENWEEAYFWGRRSIVLFRSSMTGVEEIGGEGWEEWVCESQLMAFDSKNEMGKLFYRTAVAARNLGQNGCEGRKEEEIDSLIMAAGIYLPKDPIVRTEVSAMHMRHMVRGGNDENEGDHHSSYTEGNSRSGTVSPIS
ncbi:MAG: hypothetical protein Q9217_001041 [Psora testacea]